MSGKPFQPTAVDEHIGQRIQLRRVMMGWSQKDLAQVCGVTFQQVQKYESAENRVSAARLFEISKALESQISFFFSGLPGYITEDPRARRTGRVADQDVDDPLSRNASLEIVNLFWKLPNDAQRETVLKLLRNLNGID